MLTIHQKIPQNLAITVGNTSSLNIYLKYSKYYRPDIKYEDKYNIS
jgi:hypothetical protein